MKANIIDAKKETAEDANILCNEANTVSLGSAFNTNSDSTYT